MILKDSNSSLRYCEKALTKVSRQAGDAMSRMECDTLADPEKSVTGKPMNYRSLEVGTFGLWSGVMHLDKLLFPSCNAGVTIRGIEDK